MLRIIIFSLIMALASTAMARVKYISLTQLPQQADYIILGTVEDKSTRISGPMVFTDYRIRVQKWYKGEGSNPLILSMAGGTHGDKSIGVSIATPLEVGQSYIIFGYDSRYRYANPIVGTGQGVFKVVQDSRSKAGGWIIDYHGYRLENQAGVLKRGRLTEMDEQGNVRVKALRPEPSNSLTYTVKDAQGRIIPQHPNSDQKPKRIAGQPIELKDFERFIQASLAKAKTRLGE